MEEATNLQEETESPNGAATGQAIELGRSVARIVLEHADRKGILIAGTIDEILDAVEIEAMLDSVGGEGGYFRFDHTGKPVLTLFFRSKTPPTPWDMLLTMAHEITGHYQEYSEKIKMAWRRGWTEWAVSGLYSPPAYLSEGVAQLVPRYLFPTPESLLKPVLDIYETQERAIHPDSQEAKEILNLLKIYYHINGDERMAEIEVDTTKRFENALYHDRSDETMEKARRYYMAMFVRGEDKTDARIDFIKKYGGYQYLYAFSDLKYWDWFVRQGRTAEAILRLMREPIVLGVNEELPKAA